ncbi:MAG: iron-containing alcohol dehydrogenase [Solirubrobacteraceae bacterium]
MDLLTAWTFRKPVTDLLPPHLTKLGAAVHTFRYDPLDLLVASPAENIAYRIIEADMCGPLLPALGYRHHVIADDGVPELIRNQLRDFLAGAGVLSSWHDHPGGESIKTRTMAADLEAALLAKQPRRRDVVTILGGGALLDLARCVAAAVCKGLPTALIPGTPTGLVDAGVGVKAALNDEIGGKNALGTYEAPLAVLLDRSISATVSEEVALAGLMEVLKMALIAGGELWQLFMQDARRVLTTRWQAAEAGPLARLAIREMVGRLVCNFREAILDRDVDLGHCIVSPLELRGGMLHGCAVGVDLALWMIYSKLLGWMPEDECDEVLRCMEALGAQLYSPLLTLDLLTSSLDSATRARNGLRLPIVERIGHVAIHRSVNTGVLASAVGALRERAGG